MEEVEVVRQYIENQEEHHRERTFDQEYFILLRTPGIDVPEELL